MERQQRLKEAYSKEVERLIAELEDSRSAMYKKLKSISIKSCPRLKETNKVLEENTNEFILPRFPWPPPQASSKETISPELLTQELSHPNLEDIDSHMTKALRQIGHTEYSYFVVPAGYALVTRLEKIQDNGTPTLGVERWEAKLASMSNFSLEQCLKALFTAKKGYYRIIVFVISPKAWGESQNTISEDEAVMWLRQGLNKLPDNLASTPFSYSYVSTALIYEFEQTSPKNEAHLLSPGKLSAHTHLEASGFYRALALGETIPIEIFRENKINETYK